MSEKQDIKEVPYESLCEYFRDSVKLNSDITLTLNLCRAADMIFGNNNGAVSKAELKTIVGKMKEQGFVPGDTNMLNYLFSPNFKNALDNSPNRASYNEQRLLIR